MKKCPNCGEEVPTKFKYCMNCGKILVGENQLSEEDRLNRRIAELERENQLLKKALEQLINIKNSNKDPYGCQNHIEFVTNETKDCSTESADRGKDVSHTIIYEAAVKLNTPWIDKNSVLHEFANGKGKIRLKDSVTKIGDEAFSGCSEMTSIVISDWVTEIGWCAFAACDSLEEIIIPEGTRNKFEELLYGYKDKFVEQ